MHKTFMVLAATLAATLVAAMALQPAIGAQDRAAGDVCNPNAPLGGARLEVQDLTFQSPGKVKVQGRIVDMQSVPSKFTGTSSLTGDPLMIAPGNEVTAAVSFGLRPVFGSDGALQHVCVENVAQKEISKK